MRQAKLPLPLFYPFFLPQLSEVGTQDSLCTKQAELREQTKTLAHLEQQLKDFAEAYKLIKTERNHTHSLIHKLQQVLVVFPDPHVHMRVWECD